MKLFLPSICFFLVASLLLTCRQANPEPDPFLDGAPRLKSISFSGIPQENVSIDQNTKVITVQMPARIPDYIDIIPELTDNAEWINKQSGTRGGIVFGCDSCFHIYLKNKEDLSAQTIIDYKIKPVSVASLGIGTITSPLRYFIWNPNFLTLEIPMVYLYGKKLPKQIRLHHDKTGEELIVRRDSIVKGIYTDQRLIDYSYTANKISIYLFGANLMPGSYEIELLLDDGNSLKVPQPVLVSPGTASIDYQLKTYFGYRVAVGKVLTIDGYNLFNDGITLDLLDAQDKVYQLSDLVFDRYGRQIQVLIPATLAPGQYVMRLWQNDTKLPYGYCLRINVLKDEVERPFIGTIGKETTPCSLREAVLIQRAVRVSFTSNLRQQAMLPFFQRAALKLSSLTGNTIYYAPVVTEDPNREDKNSLIIPTTVPPGLYGAVLQVLDAQNNVVAESEPYGQILDVK